MKFHVLDPQQPEWQGCFIEGDDLEDAIGKWSSSFRTGMYSISEVIPLGTYKVTFEMSIQRVAEKVEDIPF